MPINAEVNVVVGSDVRNTYRLQGDKPSATFSLVLAERRMRH